MRTPVNSQAQANPPGRDELTWRTGTYDQFVQRMRHLIHTVSVALENGRRDQPLAQMDTRVEAGRSGGADFGLALLEAWGVVCDVLAFYGERIANETFLGTASEERSIRELVNMIGYRPHPGLAAESYLSFFLGETRGAPKEARIAKGIRVESIPGQDEDSQIFETREELDARAAFNRFKPWLPSLTVSYPFHADSDLIRLAPSPNRPNSGDPLLVVAAREADGMREIVYHVRRIAQVESSAEQMLLQLAPVAKSPRRELLYEPNLYTFGRSGALFGQQAPLWDDVSDQVKRSVFPREGGLYVGDGDGTNWRRATELPEGDVRGMIVTNDGIFAAVAGAGLFRSQDEGRHWRPLRAGLGALDILCLASDDRGHIYAGTPDGLVYRSKNGGDSFTALRGKVTVTGKGLFSETKDTSMPAIAVTALFPARGELSRRMLKTLEKHLDIAAVLSLLNPGTWFKLASGMLKNSAKLLQLVFQLLKKALLWLRDKFRKSMNELEVTETTTVQKGLILFAGTENGIYRSIPGGWEAVGEGLPGYDPATGSALVLVSDFAQIDEWLVVATDQGLFRSENFGDTWRPCNRGLPNRDPSTGAADLKIFCLTTVPTETGTVLLAGTAFGIFRSEDAGANWLEANADLPMRPVEKGRAQLLVRHLASPISGERGHVFAATDNGLFYSGSAGTQWEFRNQNLRQSRFKLVDEGYADHLDRSILPLKLRAAFEKAGLGLTLFAYPIVEERGRAWTIPDEPRAGVYHLRREGRWIKVTSRITDILAMAVTPEGGVVVGTPISAYEEDEWPNLWISGNQVDLATREPEISPGSILMLVQDDFADYYTIREVSTVSRRDFTLRGTVTRLTVDHTRGLERFDLRRVQAFYLSRKRDLARIVQPNLSPIEGGTLTIAGGDHQIPSGRTLLVTGKAARARIGRVGGLFVMEDDTSELLGLSLRDPRVVATDSRMRLVAGTANGIWRFDGSSFSRLGLENHQIEHLVIEHAFDEIYASLQEAYGGYWLFRHREGRWIPLATPGPITALALRHTAFGEGHTVKGCLYAISEGLLWFSQDHGDRFQQLGSGLEGFSLTCLAVDEKRGYLYAGTARDGVYLLAPEETRWLPFNDGLENWRITCLYVEPQSGAIYVGTREGLFRAHAPGDTWVSLRRQLRIRHITAILHHRGQLFIGTRGGGVFTLYDGERAWYDYPWGISNHVSALCVDGQDRVVVATRSHAMLCAQGDRDATLEHQSLFQIRPAPQLAPETFRDLLAADFARARIELSKDAVLEVSVHEHEAWIIRDGKSRYLIYRAEDALIVVHPCTSLKLNRPTRRLDDLTTHWSFESRAALPAELTACEGEIVVEPAFEDDTTIGEAIVLAESKPFTEAAYTRLSFTRDLRRAYDPNSVVVFGNVARATHGSSHSEVLGSGDGARANQRFQLRSRELTYIMGEDGPISSLAITVNPDAQGRGVTWNEQVALFPSDSATRGFVTRRDGLDRINLIFGDGQDGARLPTGRDNIVANYRIGIGAKGNLRAGTLQQLPAAPLGVRSVDNPLPASGGLDPESPKDSRIKAPIQVRTANRILSLRDLSDYLQLYPNIGQVAVKALWNGHNILGHVTVALRDSQPLDRDGDFYRNLIRTINTIKPRTFGAVQIDAYLPQWFNLEVELMVERDRDLLQIEEDARALVTEQYSFAKATFLRQINVPDVTALLRGLEGVVAVEVIRLYPEGSMPNLHESLESAEARWDHDRHEVVPARLLLIHPQGISFAMTQLGGVT